MREKDKEWLDMMANENNSMDNYGDVSHVNIRGFSLARIARALEILTIQLDEIINKKGE
jgi:hypothetical protein